jgi:hypothetical protein
MHELFGMRESLSGTGRKFGNENLKKKKNSVRAGRLITFP